MTRAHAKRTGFDPEDLERVLRQQWRDRDGAKAAQRHAQLASSQQTGRGAKAASEPFDLEAAMAKLRAASLARQGGDGRDGQPENGQPTAPANGVAAAVFREPVINQDRVAMANAFDRDGLEVERQKVLALIGWTDGVDLNDPATWPPAAAYADRPVVALDMVRRPISEVMPRAYLVSMARMIDALEAGHMARQSAW